MNIQKGWRHAFVALSVLSVLLMLPSAGLAQADSDGVRIQIATQEPPFYVGVPVIVQLQVRGMETDPEPKCRVEPSQDGVRTKLSGISPQILQQMIQRNGHIQRIQQVTYTIQLRVTATEPGTFKVGPFVVSQNAVEKTVEAIEMSFEAVPETDEMKVKVLLPDSAYPDQRVPVKIEWWFTGDAEDIQRLNIASPVFDQFQFAPDPQPGRGASRLPIETSQGALILGAKANERVEDEKRFTVVTAQRTMIPTRPGTYELDPATATIELVTQWQRQRNSGVFGGSLFDEAFGSRRRASKIEMFRAKDEPRTFSVKPFPATGRPESFSGAVGQGFSMEVAADRTVVRVGDPIRLTINLRGDGNLETAALPSLSADGGLDPDLFRLPGGVSPGRFDSKKNQKQFLVSVRVSDESVGEIPAIAYSWFDAENEVYRTTRSKPIALRVMPAQMVGADAVVSAQRDGATSDDEPVSGVSTNAQTLPSQRTFSLSGADLSIQKDPRQLLGVSQTLLASPGLRYGGYLVGFLCVFVAMVDRRRRQVDPAKRRRDRILADAKRAVHHASTLDAKEAAAEMTNALQSVLAEVETEYRGRIDGVVAKCQAIAYRPSESSGTIDSDLVKEAIETIEMVNGEAI